jgi:transposase
VIAPKNWDPGNKKVRTDRTDTMAMAQDLDRYVGGNCKALAVVHIPTLRQEVARSRIRQRKQFQSTRNCLANRGKSLLMEYGLPAPWRWWQAGYWEQTRKTIIQRLGDLATTVLEMLEDTRDLLMEAAQKLAKLTGEQCKKRKERDKQEKGKRLRGIGELSMSVIEAEIIDWNRFKNRRQIASYTGLCPGAIGTGGTVTGLSINKCGNQRLRATLVELAWLLLRYQSGYVALQRWKAVLAGTNRAAKKKAIVALARRLAVDLWRIHTDRATPKELGLTLAA